MKISLPFKTTILFLTLSGFGVLFISLLGYYSADKLLRNEALSSLSSDLMRENISLESSIKTLKGDVRFMSNVPPVQGIIRADENEGFDEQENTMLNVWENRLISIFSTVIRQRSAYTQIRFIGVAKGGMELVRVNQNGERVTVAGKDDLQAKEKRDYFKKIAKTEKGEVYISDINYNREDGKIAQPLQSVIRVGIPVLKSSGELFGMIVINADIRKIASSLYGYAKDKFFFLANEKGEYLIHPDESRRMAFEFGRIATFQEEYGLDSNYLDNALKSFTVMELPGKRGGMALHKIYFDEENKNRFLLLGSIVDFAHLTEKSRSLGKDLAILTTAVFLFIGIISGFAVRWLIRPILNLKAVSDRITAGEEGVTIEIESNDEVGDLAQSMAMMLEKQKEAQDNLRKLAGSLEEKVQERTIKLEALNKEMESFVYTVSHDLKSPIVSLQGMVELIGEDLGTNASGDIKTYLGHMKNSITMMGDLAEDLLTLSRVGRIDFACEAIDTNEIVAQVVQEVSGRAEKKGIDIVVSPILPLVMANKKRLYQIFSNLIGNAVKFMPENAESPFVEISATAKEGLVTFVISDNGEGIDPKHHDRIFTMFQRLHGRDIPGTGMGLALVKKIVENLGGSISIRSTKGTGAVFYFTLPAGGNFSSETTS